MGDMFRSEPMVLCQMFVQPEAAYPTVSEMGEVGCVQFRDVSSPYSFSNKNFMNFSFFFSKNSS